MEGKILLLAIIALSVVAPQLALADNAYVETIQSSGYYVQSGKYPLYMVIVTAQVKNIGTETAYNVEAHCELSGSISDEKITTVGNIAPGEIKKVTFTGEYFILFEPTIYYKVWSRWEEATTSGYVQEQENGNLTIKVQPLPNSP